MASALLALAVAVLQEPATATATVVDTLRAEAERVAALVECRGTRAFLAAARALPEPAERTVLYDAKAREAVTASVHAALAPEARERFQPTPFPAAFHYTTRYGSPIAYARLLDVVGRATGRPEDDGLSGKRVLDFGYGGMGHLRMLASLGCDAVGVDVDSLLAAYYGPADQGAVARVGGGAPGRLTLVHGRWPAEAAARTAVGEGYDLVLSKNVLKQGYVRPAQSVDPRMLVDLGVSPAAFLDEVARLLKPGGVLALYNLCPAPKADRYLPWAYGESPFTREELLTAGFELLAFDVEDHAAARELGFALGWEQQGMDLEGDLFAWYTLARRR
jgi:SAM-dependent methyltransferase